MPDANSRPARIDIDAIVATRRARAIEEDKLRPAALQRQAAVKERLAKMLAEEGGKPALSLEGLQALIGSEVAKALAEKE